MEKKNALRTVRLQKTSYNSTNNKLDCKYPALTGKIIWIVSGISGHSDKYKNNCIDEY